MNLPIVEIDLIMDKLRDDGYIDYIAGQQKISKDLRASEGLNMRKNFNGAVFIADGGYVTKSSREKTDRELRDSRDRRLSNGTVYLAVGTFLLVLVESLIHRHELASIFSCH